MYVHLGGEYSISDRFIVGIFDMDSITSRQTDMIRFLTEAEKSGRAEYVSEEIPRSVVVTVDRVYFSPISTATLLKRLTDMYTHADKIFV
jgi:hypothetical protein